MINEEKQFSRVVECVSAILEPLGFIRQTQLWKKETEDCFVGLSLGRIADSKAIYGFFGCSVKPVFQNSFDEFDIGLWDSHIYGKIRTQVTGVKQTKYLCSMTLDNSQFDFTRNWLKQDPEFNSAKLEYLKNPPYNSEDKIKLFHEIFTKETLKLLTELETVEGVKRVIMDEKYCFSIWKSLARHLKIITNEQDEINIGEYNYKTFVTL